MTYNFMYYFENHHMCYTVKCLWGTCDDLQFYVLFLTHLNYFYFSNLWHVLHFKISMMYMWRFSILCYFKLFNMWYLKQLYNYFTIYIYLLCLPERLVSYFLFHSWFSFSTMFVKNYFFAMYFFFLFCMVNF
jgi:hypothetical protein